MNIQSKSAARANMMKSQILPGHVLDERILAALSQVAREDFVPPAYAKAAYADKEIPLGNHRLMMEPLDFARMLKYSDVTDEETVLDIACGAGYSAMVLSKLAQNVVAVEEEPLLSAQAQKLLAQSPNIRFVEGGLIEGYAAGAPYDAIIIEGAIGYLPQALVDQLREGGRILTAEQDEAANLGSAGLSKLVEYRKIRGSLQKTVLRDANMALLISFTHTPSFTF